MKYKFLSVLLAGLLSVCTLSSCTAPADESGKSSGATSSSAASVNKTGGTLSPSGKDDTAAIQKAISALKSGEILKLEKGTYYLTKTLEISKKKNIKIEGDNVIFVKTGLDTSTVSAKNCSVLNILESKNVTVCGITVKYDALTSLSGEIVSTLVDGGAIYIKPYDSFKPTGKEVYGAINVFDENGIPTELEKYNETGFSQKLMADGTVCIMGLSMNEVQALSVGTRVGLRASMMSDGVFQIMNSSDLVFENVKVCNAFSGVFFTTGRTFNLTLRKIDISSDNPQSYFSSNADGVHIGAIGGQLIIEDCNFEKLGDDCVNVHGMAYSVTNLNGNSLTAYMERYNTNILNEWAAKGDEIEFYDKSTFKLLGTAKVKKVNSHSGKMTFDKLPKGVTNGTVMSNKTMHPSVEITNCTVRSNRARAFLLQTENAVVKNCTIEGTRLAAVLIAPDIKYWGEVSPGKNITLIGNTFKNCGKLAGSAIITHASHDMDSNYPADVNRNLTVQSNTFLNCPSAIKATSLKGLNFSNNTLTGMGGSGIYYAVITTRCEDVEIGENNITDNSVQLYLN